MQGIYDIDDPVPPSICFINDLLWIYVPANLWKPRCIFQEQPRQHSCRPGTHLPMVLVTQKMHPEPILFQTKTWLKAK